MADAYRRLPLELRQRLDRELDRGERVMWAVQPRPWLIARSTLPIFLFAIPWTAFSIFWIAMAAKGVSSSEEGGLFILFPLFGLPFVLIGFGMLSVPWFAMRGARRTVYAVTDQRALVMRGGASANIRSFRPDELRHLDRTERRDGSGSVIFGRETSHGGHRGFSRTASTGYGFIGVDNAREAELIVRALVDASGPRPPALV